MHFKLIRGCAGEVKGTQLSSSDRVDLYCAAERNARAKYFESHLPICTVLLVQVRMNLSPS